MLLDQSKAFDLVNHELLLVRIKRTGCVALNLSRNYLREKDRVKYKDQILDVITVDSGVLQGS